MAPDDYELATRAIVEVVATLNGRFVFSACLWVLTRSLLVVSWVCIAAGIALLVRSFILRPKK